MWFWPKRRPRLDVHIWVTDTHVIVDNDGVLDVMVSPERLGPRGEVGFRIRDACPGARLGPADVYEWPHGEVG